MSRELIVNADVAELLPAPVLAQLEAVVDDDDNVCCSCQGVIAGSSTEVVVFSDGQKATLVKLAHRSCIPSGVYSMPGLGAALASSCEESDGFRMATKLGLRKRRPSALVFLEPEVLFGGLDEDPLELYAHSFGLSSVSGPVEEIEPPRSELFTVERTGEGLGVRNAHGVETVPASPSEVSRWLEAADGRALVIVARGLGLRRGEPTIEEALAYRPAWAALGQIV